MSEWNVSARRRIGALVEPYALILFAILCLWLCVFACTGLPVLTVRWALSVPMEPRR